MAKPSPRAHLVRLAGLLLLGGAGFVAVRAAMIPPTWNSANSFREGALADIEALPMKYGGRASCVDCHEDGSETHAEAAEILSEGPHKGISCETCHGPLAHHVADGKKIADARVEYSRLVCLGCHANLTGSPPWFPKFVTADEEISPRREEAVKEAGKKIYRHKDNIHRHMDCTECHYSFHNPEET